MALLFLRDSPRPRRVLFVKAHIAGYTKKDGTVVVAHEDRRPAAKKVWYHGTPEPFDGPPDLSRFGTGALEDYARAGPSSYTPALYLTDDKDHAEKYGAHVMEFNINEKPHAVIKIKGEATKWARENGHKSAQKMIDEYYDGDLYIALNVDQTLNDAAREAKKAGHKVVVLDFGDLRGGRSGRKTYGGQIALVLDPSVIRRSDKPPAP